MPTPAYMTIKGEKQGLITAGAFTGDSVGNIFQEGHEDEVLIEAFNHEVIVPTDPQSGQPSGQRVHKPMIVTKIFDKSSPLIYNALASGEKLPEITLKWYRTSAAGIQEHYFTTALTDAIIVKVQAIMPNCQDPNQSHFTHLEEVHFAYRAITWSHEGCGTSGNDDWRKPISA